MQMKTAWLEPARVAGAARAEDRHRGTGRGSPRLRGLGARHHVRQL
jgi:hypothetical protein